MSIQSAWQLSFDFLGRLPVIVEPAQAQLSSDGGLAPIIQFDKRIGFSAAFAGVLHDARDPDRIDHSVHEMFRSRLFGILSGYEDQNDHDTLRSDPMFKLVAGRSPADDPLASQPTLSRFENQVSVADLKRLGDVLLEKFLDSFETIPHRLTFDLDAVDDPAHGEQQLVLFHAYYEQHQYLPLLISNEETGQFVCVSLRPGNVHASLGADDDLERVVTAVRRRRPDVEIVVRGDCGFGVPAMYRVCERLGLTYTFGIGGNSALKAQTESLLEEAKRRYEETGEKQRLFQAFSYRAGSWDRERIVVAKVECHENGTNRRFVVTNRAGATIRPEGAYDEYVMRGESENRNKEIKVDLAMDRLSDHRFMANLFRLYLHAAAHNLLAQLRLSVREPEAPSPVDGVPVEALAGKARRDHQRRFRERDPLGKGQPCTWRTRLIKVAAEVQVSTRRVLIRLAANWPYLNLYKRVADHVQRLAAAEVASQAPPT